VTSGIPVHTDEAHLVHAAGPAFVQQWEPFAVCENVRVTTGAGARADEAVALVDSAVDLGGSVLVGAARHVALGTKSRGRKCQRREDDGSEQSASGEHFICDEELN
jgi:hypothetical protein